MPRTRSESAHKKAIQAALELVAERGIEGASMDAIAARSGVSKATLYKHWADKERLLLEMMATLIGLNARPTFDSGDIRADIAAVLSYRPKEDASVRGRILPHMLAYSVTNREFGESWRKMAMEPPRRELKRLINQGIAKGELARGLNMEFCMAMLLGPVMYWHMLLQNSGAPDLKALAESVVEVFWRAFAVEKNRAAARRDSGAL